MGKTIVDLFKKIGDTKGTFHAKMGLIKDRNGMYLTEAEDIKKRWQEYWDGFPCPPPGDPPYPRDQTHISYVSCIDRWVLYHYCHLGSPLMTYISIMVCSLT